MCTETQTRPGRRVLVILPELVGTAHAASDGIAVPRNLAPQMGVEQWDCAEPGCVAIGQARAMFVPNIGVMLKKHYGDARQIDLKAECRCRKHSQRGWISVANAKPLVAQEVAAYEGNLFTGKRYDAVREVCIGAK